MKVRVCFNCKQFIHIIPEDANNYQFLKFFDSWHKNHAVQTVELNDLDSSYLWINQDKRDQIFQEIKDFFTTTKNSN